MSLASLDIFHVLAAIAALLVFAHAFGFLAQKLGLPAIIGEIAGGLVLGATVLKRVWPDGSAWLFQPAPADALTQPTPAMLPILGICSQLGLLLLMFLGGLQMKRLVTKRDAKAVGWISSLGVLIPVGIGLVLLQFIDVDRYVGVAHSRTALDIVLLTALAVTSIPVITRIFMDLGLMKTRLARIVLSVAVIEDVLLYIAVSIAVGMADASSKADASIPAFLDMDPNSTAFILWHIAASLTLLAVASWGFRSLGNSTSARLNLIARRSPVGWQLALVFVTTIVAMLLGLAPLYGALVAGIAASNDVRPDFVAARLQIEKFATGFFIPLYFALIGVSLDLVANFDWKFTVGMLMVGTAVKYFGSLLGARIAGEPAAMANALAISVNARGGPGIVLATTAFAAGIIDSRAYTGLIILALATSVIAGTWLARILRTNPATTKLITGDGESDVAATSSPNLPAEAGVPAGAR
ncbi:MAG: sodium:proton antiporter [Thermoleophilia bacterium]|nr:sodium:proton antiporter [Thermoleophilia bacterium]